MILQGREPGTGRPLRVTVHKGRIVAVDPGPPTTTGLLTPGLIDLQVNGYAGHDVNAAASDTIPDLVRALWRRGVTTVCPTVVTAPEDAIVAALRTVAAARDSDPLLAHAIPGVHVEGPHLSEQDGARGAHARRWIRPADTDEYDRWQAASGGLVGIVTVAPESPGAPGYIRHVAGTGTLVSIGHSAASPGQVTAAVAAGARMSTHLGNGVARKLPRHPNLLWEQLADDRLTACLIADGHHLPVATLRTMLRAKGTDRTVLTSDSVALAGSAPGSYTTPVGGAVTLHDDGRLTLAGSDLLAGAARCLPECLDWATTHAGVGAADAVRMATANPAGLLGGTGRGVLRAGAVADLAVFDPGWRASVTVVAGRLVYAADDATGLVELPTSEDAR